MVSLKYTSCIPLQLPPTFRLSVYSDGESKVYTVYTTTASSDIAYHCMSLKFKWCIPLQFPPTFRLSLYSDGESKVYTVYTTTSYNILPS